MFGEPDDVDGECNARLFVGDCYGDNHATMRCQLAPEHDGLHREVYNSGKAGEVTVTWEHNAREKCDHGCGQWRDAHDDAVVCLKNAEDHEFSTCRLCHEGRDPHVCACGAEYYGSKHYRCVLTKEADDAERAAFLAAGNPDDDFSEP